MTDRIAIENQSTLSRVTCGWRKPDLAADAVWRYWRDVHSPAIARRAGIYHYRHSPFGAVRGDLFAAVPGVDFICPADAQLQWQSDVRYRGEADVEAFGASPPPDIRAHILADIEMIVDRSTTYRVVGENARTLRDDTPEAAPAGPVPTASFGVFFRQRGEEAPFRAAIRALATDWAARPGVLRVRMNLFDVPDMEAERRAGYPVKTHPQPQQYQAWIDLVLESDAVARDLLPAGLGATVAALHAYPYPAVYTFNAAGRPTFIGLRGYAAHEAINGLGGQQHRHPDLLAWMYGPVAGAGAGVMSDRTVSERLVAFARAQRDAGVPPAVLHEAARLIVNQLKASVGATDRTAIRILHDWAVDEAGGGTGAHALWLGTALPPDKAAVVNGALFEVLDFHDTYIPTFMHAVSGVLPAVLAAAEQGGQSGRTVLTALALGLEVELACATILMPTGYYRGFVPAGLVGAIGAAMACALLADLDAVQMRNALGLAMNSAFGSYETVGSMALSYVTGFVARAGLVSAQLAARGFDAPRTAFEGEKGMLSSYSNEPASKIEGVLATLGTTWRIFGQSYKTVPTETITHAPIECVLALRKRAAGRTLQRMRFGVEAIVVKIADERRDRFGLPSSELTARFDTRFCAAAAWERGRFTLAEMQEPAYTDPAILDLRARIDLEASAMHATFEGCSLENTYTDGSTDSIDVPAFLGTPGNPMSDAELAELFIASAGPHLPPGRPQAILDAAWSLQDAPNLHGFMQLLRFGA